MEINKRNLIINSALLFVIAFLWHTTLHELGHAVTAFLNRASDVALFHNYASYNTTGLTDSSLMLIVAAGPLVSLITGIVFHLICAIYKERNALFLFLLYMSSFGYLSFGGYLLIAPFFPNGDTGYLFNLWSFPMWLMVVFAILGVGFIFWIAKLLSRYFAEMATVEILSDKQRQRQFADTLIKYPLYLGVVISTLLNLPVLALISLLYPLCNPMNIFWIYGYVVDTPYDTKNANKNFDQLGRIQPLWIGIFIITVMVNRWLVYGLNF